MSTAGGYVNTRCVRKACDRLKIPYTVHDEYGNFVSVQKQKYFFVNASMPFNSSSLNKICSDKDFASRLLKDVVRMPKTLGYFDPYPKYEKYTDYIEQTNYEAITDSICSEFSFPLIIKMNSGQQGTNVFKCATKEDVSMALAAIFDHNSPHYDFVALVQEYIQPKAEYRVIVFRGEVLLAYEKNITDATFVGNLSPLHYENAKAIQILDLDLLKRFQECITPIFPILNLEFTGIDIIQDEDDKFYVIELNSRPGFTLFEKDNGDEPLVQMYEKILSSLE
ncbi:MAG: glutathione synthase/ribosomal protein S6 modification enzyme (glutaminyl transferase) [Parcubacteria bacterium C7867-007]|nr:MAG: glutathione synthase/ribosomal protein S6 modification enzyme (glutaminyl transferase) [Parcubacteria bacterium C7867-007]